MKLQTIEFVSGHKLIDNGVGDYDLLCPEGGRAGFLHPGQVAVIRRMVCGCGKIVGEPVDGSPEPYTWEPA